MNDKPLKFRIRCTSVTGCPTWVTKVTDATPGSEITTPIVSMVNKILKGKRFTKEEAEVLLPKVHTCHPEAELVEAPPSPIIVCLCGSTRFWKTFQEVNLRETCAGKIVLSLGMATKSDSEHLAEGTITPADKVKFDQLHLRKIDLCDEVLVLNVGGYIGESTRAEIEYAAANGKPVHYLETKHV